MNNTTMNEFEKLVFKMRKAQKFYFKHRGIRALETSKKLEKKVDEHLDSFINPKMEL